MKARCYERKFRQKKKSDPMKWLGRLSIRHRLYISFISLSIIPIAIVGLISYINSKNAITNKIAGYSVDSLIQSEVNLDLKLKKYENLSMALQVNNENNQALVDFIHTGSAKSIDHITRLLKNTLNLEEDIRSIFVGSLQKDVSVGAGFEDSQAILHKLKQTNLIKRALASSGKELWGNFESDMVYLHIMTDFSTGTPIGVYGVIFYGYKLSKLINPSLYDDSNAASLKNRPYTLIARLNGGILCSPNSEDIGILLPKLLHNPRIYEIFNKSQKPSGKFSDQLHRQAVLVTYKRLESRRWCLLCISPNNYLYAEIKIVGIITLIIAVSISFIAVVISMLVALSISKPLDQVKNAMQQAEQGQLNQKVTITTQDELADLGRSFNKMTLNMGELIKETKEAVAAVSRHSLVLETNSNQSACSAKTVTTATDEITKGAMEQTVEAEKTVQQMNALAQEIDNVVTESNEMKQITDLAKNISINSKEIVEQLIQKANDTDRITNTITKNINELNKSADEIGNVTAIINNITEQINLLALNAAIEAAHAGEKGKGFAVVADEVNKLSAQSKNATIMIDTMLKEIRSKTLISAQTTSQAHIIVEEQLSVVNRTRQALDAIIEAMTNVVNHITLVDDHLNSINEFKGKTVDAISNISTITEESAASSEEVAATIQQQMAIAEQTKVMATQLNDMAQKLVVEISKFEIQDF